MGNFRKIASSNSPLSPANSIFANCCTVIMLVMGDPFFAGLDPGIEKVDKWFRRVEKSLDNGYYFEVISICFNQINFILRNSILMIAKEGKDSKYLDDIFMKYDNPLLGKISDRTIYDEALRMGVIPREIYNWLNDIHNERNQLFHRLFQNHNNGYTKDAESALKVLAEKYFHTADDLVATWPLSHTETVFNWKRASNKNQKTN